MLPIVPWLIAIGLLIVGVVALANGAWVLGVILIILGLLIGPGGIRIFNTRR